MPWCKLNVARAVLVVLAVSCESSTEIVSRLTYAGVLNGAQEKPNATTSTATGQASVVVNSLGSLSYSVTWTGLSGAITGAHIHGPADSNSTASVLIDFQALPAGSAGQAITLTAAGSASGTVNVKGSSVITAAVSGDSLHRLLSVGLLYVNVHTAANPTGEIRAQLRKQ